MAILNDKEKQEFFDACENGRLGTVVAALKVHPEILNQANDNGWTGLSLAVQWAQSEVVCYLLEKGADTSLRDRDDCTAQHLSERLNFESITDLFRASAVARETAAAVREREAASAAHIAAVEQFSTGL